MVEQLRAFTYERQHLGPHATTPARALQDVIGVYSAHPSAPLSLHARTKDLTGAEFRRLDTLRLPAMRQSIHLLPRRTAHLAYRATPAPASDRKKRMKHFKLTEEAYAKLREAILEHAGEPLTLPKLRERVGADPEPFKGATAQMTRDGELVRIAAEGLRSNELRYAAIELDPADADEALAWLVGEYLRAFGPVRVKDVVWWTGTTATRVKQALAQHDTAEVDGHLMHAKDVEALEKAKAPKGVDLLPKWDCLTMGYAPDGRARLAAGELVKRCYDFRGDGRPLILADGEAIGTWEKGEPELFERAAPKLREAIGERIAAVKAFLDG